MEQGTMPRHPTPTANDFRPWRLSAAIDDDLVEIVDDLADDDAPQTQQPWRVMIADDDRSVHDATVAALAGQRIHDRPISFVHAYSARETVSLLAAGDPVHLVLLDVVMESPEAGLHAVDQIRDGLGLRDLKIVIRTGQPGQKPEQEIRRSYAIDGYANKAELTRGMLRDVIADALQPPATRDGAH